MPANDVTVLDLTPEAEAYVVVMVQLLAMEKLLASRTHLENYRIAQTVREGVATQDVDAIINDLRGTVDSLAARATPRPPIRRREV